MLKLNPGEVGLAIDNHAAFVIEGDMWRVVSAGGRVTRKIFVRRHDIAAIWAALFSSQTNASEIRCWQDNGRLEKTVLEPSPRLQPLSELLELPDFTTLGVPYRAP